MLKEILADVTRELPPLQPQEDLRRRVHEQLHAARELEQTRDRHLEHMLALAEAAEPETAPADTGVAGCGGNPYASPGPSGGCIPPAHPPPGADPSQTAAEEYKIPFRYSSDTDEQPEREARLLRLAGGRRSRATLRADFAVLRPAHFVILTDIATKLGPELGWSPS